MKYKIYKIIIPIIILILSLIGFWQICHAQQKLLLNYPDITGAFKPGEAPPNTELPNLIKYIYMFSLAVVGFVALLSIIIGAAQYVMSAGNPSKASDAKDRIYSAILGIIILLASVLILRTINPDLVNIGFRLPDITGGGDGGYGYQDPSLECYSIPCDDCYECTSDCIDGTDCAGSVNYRCLCCSYDIHGNSSCTPEDPITYAPYWPQTCNSITPSQAASNCNLACHGAKCVLPLSDLRNQVIKCIYQLVSCQ